MLHAGLKHPKYWLKCWFKINLFVREQECWRMYGLCSTSSSMSVMFSHYIGYGNILLLCFFVCLFLFLFCFVFYPLLGAFVIFWLVGSASIVLSIVLYIDRSSSWSWTLLYLFFFRIHQLGRKLELNKYHVM